MTGALGNYVTGALGNYVTGDTEALRRFTLSAYQPALALSECLT